MLTKEIVEFFEISESRKERIIRKAENHFKENLIVDFDYKYRYIAHFVENYELIPWHKYRIISPTDSREDNPVSVILGVEDPELLGFTEEYKETLPTLRFDEALKVLRSSLSEKSLEVLVEIARRQNMDGETLLNIHPDQLEMESNNIEQRLDTLREKYERNGRILIPARPIVEIKWQPNFWIKFGRRNWKEISALDWATKKFPFVYMGMAPSTLSDFDQIVYLKLCQGGNIDSVCKRKYHPLSERELRKIYDEVNGVGREAFRRYGRKPSNYIKGWKSLGLKTISLESSSDKKKIERIMYEIESVNGNISEAQRKYGRSQGTYRKYREGRKYILWTTEQIDFLKSALDSEKYYGPQVIVRAGCRPYITAGLLDIKLLTKDFNELFYRDNPISKAKVVHKINIIREKIRNSS